MIAFFSSLKTATQFLLSALFTLLLSGVGVVYAQTPSAPVNGLAQVNRGGTLAPTFALLNFTSLKLAIACGNRLPVSAAQRQISWGGISATAPPFSFDRQDKPAAPTPAQTSNTPADNDRQAYELLYDNFHRTYRLGPGDEIAVRVRFQPDYSVEKAKISPDGRLYHPLLGDLAVGGLTVDQLTKRLTQDLAKFIRDPEISVHLIEAKSAKVGVLGEVLRPGILVMNEPLTVLDAITQAGGFARTGKGSNVTLVRQTKTGRLQNMQINVKKILAGKADIEENLPLQPGDTVIVHGNVLKKLEYVTATMGFTQFLAFLTLTR